MSCTDWIRRVQWSNPLFDQIRLSDDTDTERLRKEVVGVTTVVGFVLSAFLMLFQEFSLTFVGMANMTISSFLTLGYLLVEKKMPTWLIVSYLASFCVTVVCYDLKSASEINSRDWPLFILVLDLLLVLDVGDRITFLFLAVPIFWFTLTSLENVARFGLYDLPAVLKTAGEREALFCQPGAGKCDAMPCPVSGGTGLNSFAGPLIVFLLDFYFTRGFAWNVNQEKARMHEAIVITEDIAKALADFDLAAAEADIAKAEAGCCVPEQLVLALRSVLCNLKTYRPYLPHACLPSYIREPDADTPSDSEESAPSPKAGSHQTGNTSSASMRSIRKGKALVTPVRVAALALNVVNALQKLLGDASGYSSMFDRVLSSVVAAAMQNHGVTDLILGDHVVVSFNAARTCHTFCTSAARVASTVIGQFPPRTLNAGIASGKAHCGVVGCSEMKRFTMFGTCVPVALAIERLGCKSGHPIVCDSYVQRDVYTSFEMRLIPKLLVVNCKGRNTTQRGWYITGGRSNDEGLNDEWMYELQDREQEGLHPFDAVLMLYFEGHLKEALAKLASIPLPDLTDEARTLEKRMIASEAPEVYTINA
ncbi:hypothetical protein DIPPA_10805 [Diplonema papillatum]|nr:hypothetical protein DIPPA_10805 [Diplonema papillatum]